MLRWAWLRLVPNFCGTATLASSYFREIVQQWISSCSKVVVPANSYYFSERKSCVWCFWDQVERSRDGGAIWQGRRPAGSWAAAWMRVVSLGDGYLYNFDNWGYCLADASPAASLVAVLIIIKALIFLSAFIYQLVNQLRPPQHSNTSALLHYLPSHFYTSLLHFFPQAALIKPLFPLLQQLFSNDPESYALKFA